MSAASYRSTGAAFLPAQQPWGPPPCFPPRLARGPKVGFAQFDDGKPASEAVQNTCFSCHEVARSRDFVFNRYSP